MIADNKRPWQQMDGESDEAYLRFQHYVHLGPGRTLLSAYRAYAAECGEGDTAKAHLPGSWNRDSRSLNWVARARAWDLFVVRIHGHDGVVAMVAAVREATRRILQAIERLDGPADWQQVLESLSVISQLIPPETVAAVLSNGLPVPDGEVAEPGQIDPVEQSGPPPRVARPSRVGGEEVGDEGEQHGDKADDDGCRRVRTDCTGSGG